MRSIANILKNQSSASPLVRGVTAAMTVEAANEVLGMMFGVSIKNHAAAMYLKNGALSVACLSSTVAQEIKLREREVLNKVNEMVGVDAAKKIIYLS